MTAVREITTDGRAPGARRARRPRGGVGGRLSRGHWIALAVGALAALVNVAVLRDRSSMAEVLVAREPIAPASPVTAEMVETIEVPADSPVTRSLVDMSAITGGELVSTRAIPAGEPLTTSSLSSEAAGGGLRSMSVPIEPEHASGGSLRPGDVVDVIDVVDARSSYAASGVEVLAVGDESQGSASETPGGFDVVVAVDADQALRIASALADERIEIVRSTGAPPVAEGDAPPIVGSAGGGG